MGGKGAGRRERSGDESSALWDEIVGTGMDAGAAGAGTVGGGRRLDLVANLVLPLVGCENFLSTMKAKFKLFNHKSSNYYLSCNINFDQSRPHRLKMLI